MEECPGGSRTSNTGDSMVNSGLLVKAEGVIPLPRSPIPFLVSKSWALGRWSQGRVMC